MDIYKIHIDDRNYRSWTIYNADTLEQVKVDNLDPIKEKLFSNDVFTFSENTTNIIHSSIRLNENIPCVLILEGNKTYGREKKTIEGKTYTKDAAKNQLGRLLYKCIPDDYRLPEFLVPYELKQIGFSKVQANLYVTIKFKSWINNHPIGQLTQSIGPVNILDNFYEYQLYCKSLNASIQKFNKDTTTALHNKTINHNEFIENIFKKNNSIEDRTLWKVFTIDPETSTDYDDGFSIKKLNDGHTLLSIYIANVTIWLDALNLWSSFSQRISTIYLPDRKRPMLPTILSDCLCSLQQNVNRFAFTMDIIINNDGFIVDISYKNTMIKVYKNYAYESSELFCDPDYYDILDICKLLSDKGKYKYINNIKTSHDVVCYLMILMNYNCAQELLKNKNGIFRSTIVNHNFIIPKELPEDVSKFIKIWNSASGQYINIEKENVATAHELLEVDAYIHITSPIRRLVDLLNIIKFQKNKNLINLTEDALKFYDNWLQKLDYINVTMRAIRKVQNDCNLLDLCNKDDTILEKEYDGYCFDKLIRNDGLHQYIVFLPELRLSARMTMRENLQEYDKRKYKLYLFNNEEKFKKKIRLQII